MFKINGKKFAKNNSEFTDSLFETGGTCCGYYRQNKGGVVLMDHNKLPTVFLVANSHDEFFAVTCYRTDSGKIRYMFGLSDAGEKFSGMNEVAYGDQRDRIKEAIANL